MLRTNARGRGQFSSRLSLRPRTKFWPRSQLVLEDLRSLPLGMTAEQVLPDKISAWIDISSVQRKKRENIVPSVLIRVSIRPFTNTHKRILMGNRRKMALWGIVMRTMQTCRETIRWPRGESALPHKTIVCNSFSIAFARWLYQFPHRILSGNSGYPTTKVTDAGSSTPCWGVVGGLVQYLLTAS